MTFYDLSIVATLSAAFAVVCVYIFLYSLYRHRYIALWAIFWVVLFGSECFYRTSPLQSLPLFVIIEITLVANYVMLVFATSNFLERKMHRGWYCFALLAISFTYISFWPDEPLLIESNSGIYFVAYVNIWHGWMYIHHLKHQGWSKNIVGLAFIGIGLHTLDMPFLVTIAWFAPWGFLMSGTFRFIISIGTLMLFVEKNHGI